MSDQEFETLLRSIYRELGEIRTAQAAILEAARESKKDAKTIETRVRSLENRSAWMAGALAILAGAWAYVAKVVPVHKLFN